ncbi:unnamed protein product [Heligmosomoides polygyrus]|uniref:DZF domain-containing protein n=1 Tax=Heligmosomoides polygyrus TaxID=6339 RepID=A0A3P7ZVS8_HELPZ|nr:unnamed protein product [Heligmosomoides polygyrus]
MSSSPCNADSADLDICDATTIMAYLIPTLEDLQATQSAMQTTQSAMQAEMLVDQLALRAELKHLHAALQVLIMFVLVYLNCSRLRLLYDRKRTHYFRPYYIDPQVHVTSMQPYTTSSKRPGYYQGRTRPEEGRRLDVGLAEVVVDAQESIVGLHGIQVGPVGRPGCDEDIEWETLSVLEEQLKTVAELSNGRSRSLLYSFLKAAPFHKWRESFVETPA